MEWQFLAADLLPDQLWVIASIHFQNTPIHPSPEEKGKKNLSISPCVWVVAPSAREAPICLSLSFPFPTVHLKKSPNLLSLSSLLLTNQPVYREFETTVKCLKRSEAQGGTFR